MSDYSKTKLVSSANDAEMLELLHLLKTDRFKYISGDEIDDNNLTFISAHQTKLDKRYIFQHVCLVSKLASIASLFCFSILNTFAFITDQIEELF